MIGIPVVGGVGSEPNAGIGDLPVCVFSPLAELGIGASRTR
jgi:hypothetical protein